MVYVLADNIISPLGETSEENYQAVKAGRSAIHAYIPMTDGIPDGFMASLLPRKQLKYRVLMYPINEQFLY